MAEDQSIDFLLVCLNKATDPENSSERWECMQEFSQHVNTHTNGPQIATRLLAHKIQSPQEKEALQALTLLEVCMNNCGKRFHNEAAKFRFLNELIKVLSPKYLGMWSTVQVKQRVTEVLYSWTQWLKDEQKVQEAYIMLKKQGLDPQNSEKDPTIPSTVAMPPPSPRQESVFDNEDTSKLLSRLLKSGRAEDLETANTLIKSTLQEEQEKMEKESRRVCTLQEVENCTTQLKLLLNQQHTQHTPEMQDLYERCDRLRSNLFRLASDTVNNDEALAEILNRNDELTHVMTLYREKSHTETDTTPVSPLKSYHLIDFSLLGDDAPCGQVEQNTTLPQEEEHQKIHGADSSRVPLGVKSYMDDLLQLEDTENIMRETEQSDYITHNASVMDSELRSRSTSSDSQPITSCRVYKPRPFLSLTDISVSLDSIKPSHIKPLSVYNHRGVDVSLHFTKEVPPSPPDVAVIIVSAVNTSPLPVSDFLFLAAVPKAATGNRLPPYSPLLPPAALSQILLLSNPLRKAVRLRYRVTLSLGAERLQHDGDVEHFPQWNSWTHI